MPSALPGLVSYPKLPSVIGSSWVRLKRRSSTVSRSIRWPPQIRPAGGVGFLPTNLFPEALDAIDLIFRISCKTSLGAGLRHSLTNKATSVLFPRAKHDDGPDVSNLSYNDNDRQSGRCSRGGRY